MAKSNFVQNSFVSGELSEELKSRTDIDQYFKGMETATNVVTAPQGGVKRRMGSEFVGVPVGPSARDTSGAFNDPDTNGIDSVNQLDDDDRTTVYTSGGSDVNKSISTNDGWVSWQHTFLFGLTDTHKFVDIQGIKFTSDVTSTEFDLESSEDNTTWVKEADIPKITNFEQDFRITIDIPVANAVGADTRVRRYWRLVRNGTTDLGTAVLSIENVNFYKVDESTPDGKYKMHSFEVDKSNSFLLFFTPTNLRIYRVTDTATTFLQDIDHGLGDNFPNRVAANENVLLLFNKNAETKRLVYNYNNDGKFYYDTFPYTNVPRYGFDDRNSPTIIDAIASVTFHNNHVAGDKYQLEIDGVLSKEIVYHGDSNTDEQTATARAMQINLQDMPVFGDSGITVARTNTDEYTITMTGDSANSYALLTGFSTTNTHPLVFSDYQEGRDAKEEIWSATRGYPNLGVFAEGRLWLGGTRDKPQVLMASQVGNYADFLVDKGVDTEGFLFTMNGAKSSIVDITGGRGVTVFTEGAEFAVTGNTPSTLGAEQQTQHGSFSSNVPTLALDGATLFVDRNGRSLRQFIFDYREEGFRSVDLSVLSSHLLKDPLDMDAVTSVTSKDANYVFVINGDGSAVVLNTLREQDINGFVKFDQVRTAVPADQILSNPNSVAFAGATDKYEQVVAVNNVLHVLSNVGNSSNYTYNWNISRLTFDRLLDYSVKFEPKAVPDQGVYYHDQYIGALKHLKGTQVTNVLAGNSVLSPRYLTPSSATGTENTITLTDEERRLNLPIVVGRNFVPEVKPMPVSTLMSNGDNTQMAQKRINRMNLRVIESAGVNIDGVAVPVREFGGADDSPLNTSLEPSTGIIEDNNGGNGWGREIAPKITVPDATPFHLLAIDYEISS
jgi:hypothetical protein